jgi:hypothetical protein
MNVNEVKKDLYKSKAVAKLSHYDGDTGQLVYIVELFGIPHQFPLKVYEYVDEEVEVKLDANQGIVTVTKMRLADDLRGAKFAPEIKGSNLNRWIVKAIENSELVALAPQE